MPIVPEWSPNIKNTKYNFPDRDNESNTEFIL